MRYFLLAIICLDIFGYFVDRISSMLSAIGFGLNPRSTEIRQLENAIPEEKKCLFSIYDNTV
jgi:hypothetical protein